MAILIHLSFDPKRIRRYKYFKHVVNGDIVPLKSSREIIDYHQALEKKVIFPFAEESETGFFVRIRSDLLYRGF